jgi:hypothetical protein
LPIIPIDGVVWVLSMETAGGFVPISPKAFLIDYYGCFVSS